MAVAHDNLARTTYTQAFPLESPRSHPSVEKAPVRKFNMASLFACVGLAVAVFWYIAGFGAKIDSANYQIDNLQSQINVATAQNAALTAKVTSLKEPSHILQVALANGDKYANPVTIPVKTKH